MSAAKTSKPKRAPKRWLKILRAVLIILVILAVAWFGFLRGVVRNMNAANTAEYISYKVARGDITDSVSGTGAASPLQQFDVVSTVKGDVLNDSIEIGQKVTKGEILYTIDDADAQTNIQHAELSLERAQISYDQAVDQAASQTNTDDPNLIAGISGTVTSLLVKNGDTIAKGTRVATLADMQTLLLRVPFHTSDAGAIGSGDMAVVTLDTTGEIVIGRVKKVTTGTYASDTGAVVRDVEITFQNPGAVKIGDSATAQCGDLACQDAGLVDYGDTATVTAKASGDVRGITVSEGDRVGGGTVLGWVEDTTPDNTQSNERASALSLQEAQLSLDESKKQLDNYVITSPINGTVVDKLIKEGDTLEAGRTTLAVVADMSSLIFKMNIDELDIDKIAEGQTVVVTADALPGQVFTGRVDNIGILGASSNGVTTYPVKVVIDEYGALRPGMNLSAEIIFRSVNNVLTAPIDAVTRGNLVLVSEETARNLPVADDSRDMNPGKVVDMPDTPAGYKYVRVSVGVNNGVSVEITDGLTEGMEIFVEAPSSSGNANRNSMFSGMGGGNFGAPRQYSGNGNTTGSGPDVVVQDGGGAKAGG